MQNEDGTLLVESDAFPDEAKPESQAFVKVHNLYKDSENLNWTMLAPAPVIEPGERTGEYKVVKDHPAGQSIWAADFAVELVDEAENPQHAGTRFTVAN